MNLYTKYRSQKFTEVVGQKHVVLILSNALAHDRVGHAYLFSGPRGTGKTTIARLLAKSLNCANREKGHFEPCNHCQSCREITSGISLDIIEIDAASNRGIDEIRALRDKVRFAPSGKKFKIFIIDEVHMLTREAFNALLKTLEEPPKHAIFILATTELHKVPDTIISRTQQFDFKLHILPDIINQLKLICQKEKIKIDQESLNLIAQVAKGGLRDAISLLDQLANTGAKIYEKVTRQILGLSSYQSLLNFIKLLINDERQSLFELIEKLYEQGIDFYQFNNEILEKLRFILLFKYHDEKILANATKDEKRSMVEIADKINIEKLIIYLEKFLHVSEEIKYASLIQLPLELAVLELTAENTSNKVEIKKIPPKNNLIKKLTKENIEKSSKIEPKAAKTIKIVNSPKFNINIQEILNKRPAVLHSCGSHALLSTLLQKSKPLEIKDERLFIAVQFKFYKEKLETKKVYQQIAEIIEKEVGQSLGLKFIVDESLINHQNTSLIKPKTDGLLSDAMEVFG